MILRPLTPILSLFFVVMAMFRQARRQGQHPPNCRREVPRNAAQCSAHHQPGSCQLTQLALVVHTELVFIPNLFTLGAPRTPDDDVRFSV
jgi:hypothetical protein